MHTEYIERADRLPSMTGQLGSRSFGFGPYLVFAEQRVILHAGQQVKIGTRAFDLLLTLAAHPGEVMSHADLLAAVWGKTIVDESSLRVQLGLLRKALADGVGGAHSIDTVPGRGYRFVARITNDWHRPSGASMGWQTGADSASRAPLRHDGVLIGREAELSAILEMVARARLVTVVGVRGIGKSALVAAAAARLAPSFTRGCCMLDLSHAADATEVLTSVAAAISSKPASAAETQLLLVLDNCDRHLEGVASLARILAGTAPGVHILLTARRPSCAETGTVIELGPLRSPSNKAGGAADALACPAVQLFVDQLQSHTGSFTLDDRSAGIISEVCRRVAGAPSAIKSAACQMARIPQSTLTRADHSDLLHALCEGGFLFPGERPDDAFHEPVHDHDFTVAQTS